MSSSYVVHNTPTVLTQSELIALANNRLLVDTSGANDVLLGPDTAATAANFQLFFNIYNLGDQRLLQLLPTSNVIGNNVQFGNNSGTNNFINVSLNGVTASLQVLFAALPVLGSTVGAHAYILATATNVTPGSESILFEVLQQSGSNA